MVSIQAEAAPYVINAFETFYGDSIDNFYPDATNSCYLCHVTSNMPDKNWYGACLKCTADTVYGGIHKSSVQYAYAVADCDALDSDSDGWTTNEEVFASHGLGRPTLPGNNFAEAQSLAPDAASVGTITNLQAVFYDVDYGQVTPYVGSLLQDQPARVEWEIDEAGQGFSNGTGLLQQSGPITIYNSVYSNTLADNTFTWTPGVLMDSMVYSWRVRFMDGNVEGDTHEWGNWAYASITTNGLICTDSDGDTYAIEGGSCGLIDCNDTDPAVNPGAAEVCGDGIDNNCDTQIDEGCCTDADGDTYAIEGGSCGMIDCDDTDPAVNPGAAEVCDDGIDNDCDGKVDCADKKDCKNFPGC